MMCFTYLLTILCDEWRKCKRVVAIEASSPQKDPNFLLLSSSKKFSSEEITPAESSFAAAERLCEAFVLIHQLRTFTTSRPLPDQPSIAPSVSVSELQGWMILIRSQALRHRH